MGSLKINIYIDTNNLHRSALELGFEINYKRFKNWLRQKYDNPCVYLFLGYIKANDSLYAYLKQCGFVLIFKDTFHTTSTIKGNCDAELVLNSVSDYYQSKFKKCILVTNDGDFGCLIEFLKNRNALHTVLSPNKAKCSFLIRNKNIKITYLNDTYKKFSSVIKKPPP